jgi:hypothetical protein
MSNIVLGASCKYEYDLPAEYLSHLKRRTIEKCWIDILDKVVLENRDKFVVIKMYDIEEPNDWGSKSYQVRFSVDYAQERHVQLVAYEEMSNAAIYRSAIQEIKYRIKNRIKRWLP